MLFMHWQKQPKSGNNALLIHFQVSSLQTSTKTILQEGQAPSCILYVNRQDVSLQRFALVLVQNLPLKSSSFTLSVILRPKLKARNVITSHR